MKITLKNITKKFGSTIAAKDFSCELPDGHLICVLGPSGCGKSTILNMLCGIVQPTEGQIFFDDEDVTKLPPDQRNIGMVFQNYALYPHLTVLENISFPLEIKKVPKKERFEKAKEIAKLVQVDGLLKRYPAELSGGQQQRVAIARALIKNPKILLMDEPLSNLDARLRLEMREEIRRIQLETGVTTIFVTHDQEEAMSISDSIILMKDGILIQEGLSQDLYNKPNCNFVAEFLGNPPINKIKNSKELINSLNNNKLLPYDFSKFLDEEYFVEIRPECFRISSLKNAIKCKVLRISQMGKEELVYLEFLGQEVCAILQTEEDLEVGKELLIDFKQRGFFIFDKNGKLQELK
ncbi:MAG: ABC transporter ATP-binding protein [Treponema bryantii]|nr:ABC transporter ATP-binding protein [Treponema bryantii]